MYSSSGEVLPVGTLGKSTTNFTPQHKKATYYKLASTITVKYTAIIGSEDSEKGFESELHSDRNTQVFTQ